MVFQRKQGDYGPTGSTYFAETGGRLECIWKNETTLCVCSVLWLKHHRLKLAGMNIHVHVVFPVKY